MCGIFGYCSYLKPKVCICAFLPSIVASAGVVTRQPRDWYRARTSLKTKRITARPHPSDEPCKLTGLSPLQDRKEICDILCNGLARQEYRGYDSAGIGIDGDVPGDVFFFKEVGKVAGLRQRIAGAKVDTSKVFNSQVSIAHTRWATHGPPSVLNCHPLRSDPTNDFIVVHNGIVTNAAALRLVLQNRGYKFESETDTEAVAILTKYVYDSQPDKRITFTELVKAVLKELEGSFALVLKSKHYPDQVVTARRGSPLLIGVKTEKKLKVDFVDVEFATQEPHQKIVEPRKLRNPPKWSSFHFSDSALSLSYHVCWPPRPPDCQPQDHAHTISRVHVRGWPSPAH
jgi:Glutamine amidotransferase domain